MTNYVEKEFGHRNRSIESEIEALKDEIRTKIDKFPIENHQIVSSKELIDKLYQKEANLVELFDSIQSKIKEIWDKYDISALNNEIKVLVCQKITLKGPILGVLDKLYNELERCLKLKNDNMKDFIAKIRLDISIYNAKLYLSDQEQASFRYQFTSTDFNEALLHQHEIYLNELKSKYNQFNGLYDKIAKWKSLWDEFVQFEEHTKDPNRFKLRTFNGVEEEKSRKKFQTQIPKLEDEIKALTNEYRQIKRQEFTIYAQKWQEYIKAIKSEYETAKKRDKQTTQNTKQMTNKRKAETDITTHDKQTKVLKTEYCSPKQVFNSSVRRKTLRTPKNTPPNRIVRKSILNDSNRYPFKQHNELVANVKFVNDPITKPFSSIAKHDLNSTFTKE